MKSSGINQRTVIFLAVLLISIIGFLLLEKGMRGPEDTPENILLPDMIKHINAIDRIQVRTSENAWQLQGKQDQWTIQEKDSYRADFRLIQSLLVGMVDLRKLEAKTSDPERFSELHLNDVTMPEAKSIEFTLYVDNREVAALLVGKTHPSPQNPDLKEAYVRIPGQTQVWLVKTVLEPQRELIEWLDRRIIDLPRERIREARVEGESRKMIRIFRSSSGEKDFSLSSIPDGYQVSQQFKVNDIGGVLEKLNLENVALASQRQPSIQLTVETFDGLVVKASTGNSEYRFYWMFEAEAMPDADEAVQQEVQELNQRWSKWMYKLSAVRLNTLETNFESLVEPDSN